MKHPAKFDTQTIHAGQHPDPVTGAVMPPISVSSTYAQRSPGEHAGFEYSRSHNPTRYALERMIAKLEGSPIEESQDPSCGGFALASGLAATTTVLELLDTGDEVVCMDDVYGGTNRLLSRVAERSRGLRIKYIDMTDLKRLEAALTAATKLVWIETPTNPTLKIVDLAAAVKLVRSKSPKAIVVCDNTFATPYNQRPLEFGCDVVMHSATKYLGGHSDAVAGLLVVKDLALAQRVRFLQNAVGAVLGPFDSYMILRGIKTLSLRMARHNASGQRIAEWLAKHPLVERIAYPGLASHPQHAIAKRQMAGSGVPGFTGMVTFYIKGGIEESRRFLENVKLFTLAESLGGVESLVDHPAIMTHASVPPDQRKALGISDSLIRLSVGIEDCDDLIADLEGAFRAVGAGVGGAGARPRQHVGA